MKKRPCECGCSFEDHANKYSSLAMYCTKCPASETWCYNYREIGNLEYLEWLSK